MKQLFIGVTLSTLYFFTGRLCLLLAMPPGYSSPLWIPIGIMVAGLFSFRLRLLIPATFVGALLVTFSAAADNHGASWFSFLLAAAVAVGSILCLLLASFFIQRARLDDLPRKSPARELRLLGLILGVGLLSPLVSALWGSGMIFSQGFFEPTYFLANCLQWWSGDSAGIMLLFLAGFQFAQAARQKGNSAKWTSAAKLLILPFFVFIGLLISFRYANKTEMSYMHNLFAKSADRVAQHLEDELHLDMEFMRGTVGFIESSVHVTEKEFHSFLSENFEHHKSIEQLLWFPTGSDPAYNANYSHGAATAHFDPLFVKDKIWKKINRATQPLLGPQMQNRQLLVYPVYKNKNTIGYLVGVINLENLIRLVTHKSQVRGYQIEVTDRDTSLATLWRNDVLPQNEAEVIRYNYEFRVMEHLWNVGIATTRSQLFEIVEKPFLPFLLFGIIVAFCVTALQMIIYFNMQKHEQ